MDQGASNRLLEIEPAALEFLLSARAEEEDPSAMALRLDAQVEAGAFVYDLVFVRTTLVPLGDHLERHGELRVCIPAGSVDRVRGASLQMHPSKGLSLRNPNKPVLEVTGLISDDELARGVTAVIEREVSPALAVHDGGVRLVGHDGSGVVYLEMLGGCHGCGLSRQTMTESVARMLQDHLAEVREVRDITDHSTGTNPYYR